MFIKYIYEYVLSALEVRPVTLPIQPHLPISDSTLYMWLYISESQVEPKHTQTSITLHLAMELGPFLLTSQKFNPQNTELSVINV